MNTKFTPDYISRAKRAAVFFGEPACSEFRSVLNEIERLRKALELIRDEQPKHNGDYWCRRIAEDAIGEKESED